MTSSAEDLQQRWRGVAKRFPAWRMPLDLVFDSGSWQLVGADITSLVMKNKNARRAAAALEGASAETLEALTTIAKVNEQRSSELFRAVFLAYVSVPLALTAMLTDSAPEILHRYVSAFIPIIIVLLIGGAVLPIVYFCGNWRAKQIAWVVELYRAGALTPPADTRR